MPSFHKPGPLGSQTKDFLADHSVASGRSIVGVGSNDPLAQAAAKTEAQSLAIDLIQMAFDLAGFVDPTPISDAGGAVIALARGQWLDAVISGVSMIPYVGDLAKAGKLPKYLKTIEKVVDLARQSEKFAAALLPGIQKLRDVLHLIPNGANKQIDRIKELVEQFLNARHARKAAAALPDISKQFNFRKYESKNFIYKEARGRLGVPGKVKTHRSKSAQTGVSSGTGDDAGHLIGDRFGAAGDQSNLSPQNWISNRYGTFKQLEDGWEKKLREGWGVEVVVADVTKKTADRPFMRKVEWTEISPTGQRTTHRLDFANSHSVKSREMRDIEPTVSTPQENNLRRLDDYRNRPRRK